MIPASIRNCNPGAMYPGPSARKYGSTSFEVLRSRDGVHKIATFPDHIQGAAALFDLLASPSYTGRTIEDAIRKWCGGFYVSTYISVLEKEGRISRRTMLTRELLRDQAIAIPLARAMALQEAGQDYPLNHEGWFRAHAMAFPEGALHTERPAPVPSPPDAHAPDNDMPSPRPGTRIWETVRGSRTIGGALVAIIGGIVQYVDDAIRLALETAAQVSAWEPITALATTMGANVRGLGLALGIAGCALVIARRINATAEGAAK